MAEKELKYYSKTEEFANVVTHGTGLILSIFALFYLFFLALDKGNIEHTVSFTIFALSSITLYAASTLYHSTQEPKLRKKLNIFDHAAIYILTAGSYTPFIMIGLHGTWKWSMLALIWTIAIGGVIFKLFFTGRMKMLSTILYIIAGWVVVIMYQPLKEGVSAEILNWIIVGGVSYTVGAVLYMIKKLPYNHAIFHVFALLGTISHFIATTLLVHF